ncbi:hypothetical protein H2198_000898 [Neophaeococcomyces mojaviensis]|uniref:Uncharacterized protein n=1 Tax=Neophaeococcomyces mojaviensis TaxID=3383035 RepID=A0ACC3AJ96_9EURO|nr:hypothetical protein H2198_000898 [Knufia sp. JES_112]
MADTRRVNSTYSLEVDIMMLEYTLYKAIEAHLQLFQEIDTFSTLVNKNSDISAAFQASPASTLTETYDTLILLFKHNHPHESQKPSTQFDTRILQFLTLLRIWLLRRIDKHNGLCPSVSPEMQHNLLSAQIINQTYRRLWRHYRAVPMSPLDQLPVDPWSLRTNPELVDFADHVVPCFMEISEEFASAFQGLSEKWMYLAAHLLTQSAIEILASTSEIQAPESCVDTKTGNTQQALESCFAWGHVERRRFTEHSTIIVPPQLQCNLIFRNLSADTQHELLQVATQKTDFEDRIWEMFFYQGSKSTPSTSISGEDAIASATKINMSNGSPQSSGELKSWTKIRQDALEDVLLTYTNMLEAGENHRERPLRILRDQYPINRLLRELIDFVSKHWIALHSRNWNGKPVLVQIEEGGLDGMSEEEFERFKERAGITGMP